MFFFVFQHQELFRVLVMEIASPYVTRARHEQCVWQLISVQKRVSEFECKSYYNYVISWQRDELGANNELRNLLESE